MRPSYYISIWDEWAVSAFEDVEDITAEEQELIDSYWETVAELQETQN